MIWSEMTKEQRVQAVAAGMLDGHSASVIAKDLHAPFRNCIIGYWSRHRDEIHALVRPAGGRMPEHGKHPDKILNSAGETVVSPTRVASRQPSEPAKPAVLAEPVVFRAPVLPPKTLPPVAGPSGVPFLDRQRNQCAMPKWPDEVPARAIGAGNLFVCGKPTVHHTSWCADCLPKTMSARGNANFAAKLQRIAKRDRASRSNPPRVPPALTPPEGTAGVPPTRGATAGPDVFPAPSSGPAL